MKKLGIVGFSVLVAALAACSNDPVATVDMGTTTDLGMTTDSGTDAGPTACATYCTGIQTTCTGANVQYADEASCLAACSTNNKWPDGTAGAVSGNSFACRSYHLGAAASDANTHCIHAGPTGGGACGSLCENYCQLAMSNCTGANEIYTDNAACMTACEGLTTLGDVGDTAGNTVQCRIYHLGVAGSSSANATTHCPHGAEDGGGVCIGAT